MRKKKKLGGGSEKNIKRALGGRKNRRCGKVTFSDVHWWRCKTGPEIPKRWMAALFGRRRETSDARTTDETATAAAHHGKRVHCSFQSSSTFDQPTRLDHLRSFSPLLSSPTTHFTVNPKFHLTPRIFPSLFCLPTALLLPPLHHPIFCSSTLDSALAQRHHSAATRTTPATSSASSACFPPLAFFFDAKPPGEKLVHSCYL